MRAGGIHDDFSPTDLDHASPHDLEPVAAQTRAYVAAFAQKKRKAAQLEGQLQSLLSTVKLMAVKQSQTDEQCADLKDALHKIVTRRSVFVL